MKALRSEVVFICVAINVNVKLYKRKGKGCYRRHKGELPSLKKSISASDADIDIPLYE